MSGWTVEVLDDEVEAELNTWPAELRASLAHIILRIKSIGIERMCEPHVKHIDGKLWEMRASGKDTEGRALYVTATGRRVIIVLTFIKKTRKTPRHIIEKAQERARSIGQ
jgi:phage-related protein